MPSWIKILFEYIPWGKIRDSITDIVNSQSVALLCSGLLLIGSITSFGVYLNRSSVYEQIVSKTIKSKLEPTPQSYKGLESFLLANMRQGIDSEIKKDHLTKNFKDKFKALINQLNEFASAESRQPDLETQIKLLEEQVKDLQKKSQNGIAPIKVVDSIMQAIQEFKEGKLNIPQLQLSPGQNDGKILTQKISGDDKRVGPGFLFLPLYLLRPGFTQIELGKLKANSPDARQIIEDKLKQDPYLIRDVLLVQELSSTLQQFTNIPVIQTSNNGPVITPKQVYTITRNGINRIITNVSETPYEYYGSQFSPTIYFPSRPYYWEGYKMQSDFWEKYDPNSNDSGPGIEQLFYVSQPYLDLGGNGVVVTLSTALKATYQPDGGEQESKIYGVVCFDLTFPDGFLQSTLRDQLQAVKADYIEADIKMLNPTSCERNVKFRSEGMKEGLEYQLFTEMERFIFQSMAGGERSQVLGNIRVLSDDAGEELHLSIPVSQPRYTTDSHNYESLKVESGFILASINLPKYRRVTSYIGALAGLFLASTIVLITLAWAKTIRHKNEFEKAFLRVGKVMLHSPIPYVRLDAEDRIVDCNLSFCEKFGLTEDEHLREAMLNCTFRSLCADAASRKEYDAVQENRKNRQPVDPYTIKFRYPKPGFKEFQAKVVSADIPSTSISGKMPETFGILLD